MCQRDLLTVFLLPLAIPQDPVMRTDFQAAGLHKRTVTFSRCIVSISASVNHIDASLLHKTCRIGGESFALEMGNVEVVTIMRVESTSTKLINILAKG